MSSNKFCIADMHLWHDNVLLFDNRPFPNCDVMAQEIKEKWNEHVPKNADVYILGDVVWKFSKEVAQYLKSLNGTKHLIKGNHDKFNSAEFKSVFAEIVPYKKITDVVNGQSRQIIMSHYYMPFYEGHYHNSILLHGHSHITKESDYERKITKYLQEQGFPMAVYNVGCMYPYMDYTPRTIEEIISGYNKWEKEQR